MTGTVQTSILSSKEETIQRTNICYVTEIDKDRKLGGAITNDLKTINCLRKLGTVDSIYLKMQKYRSAWLAFPVFAWQILRSSSKPYQAYFCRGLFASFTLLFLKPIHRKNVIHNALSIPFPSIETRYSRRNKLFGFIWFSLMRFLERVVILNADAIVVADESYRTELLKNGVKEDKIQVVPFYIEDEFFQVPLKLNASGAFTFSYVGGFHPYHLLMPVIEAFEHISKENDNIELHLVGEGPLRSDIENEVSKRGLTEKIKFLGRLQHSSVPNFLSKVDSFIVLMHKPGIPTSLLEAAAAGKAIITSKRKADTTLEQYFRHGKEILYVKDTSSQEIAKAMILVSENTKVRNALSLGARKIAMQYFSENVSSGQLQELVQKFALRPQEMTNPKR
jgi:glycosyltransferase involved in cell wall biosynthesis